MSTTYVTVTISLDDLYAAASACQYAAQERAESSSPWDEDDERERDADVAMWNTTGDNIESIIREVAA